MGYVYDRNQNLHFSHHKGSIFLPMLCSSKPSVVKDVVMHPKWKDNKSSDDPLSPKISCMGQVKRNNRIVGFPALDITTKINRCNTTTTTATNMNIKYFKLKKLFSSNRCRRKQGLVNGGKEGSGSGSSSINIENMDPPLPVVIKKVPKQESTACIHDGDTLWKRRSRGVSLENLQLQQIQLKQHQEPTTV